MRAKRKSVEPTVSLTVRVSIPAREKFENERMKRHFTQTEMFEFLLTGLHPQKWRRIAVKRLALSQSLKIC
jgi:hypothetical protein